MFFKKKAPKPVWQPSTPRETTIQFIDHVYRNYYKSYSSEASLYETMNNIFTVTIMVFGFVATISAALQKSWVENETGKDVLSLLTLILPALSSVLVGFVAQKGYKQKEVIREDSRIRSKYLVDEARIRVATATEDKEYVEIYRWLNKEIYDLQLNQAASYFSSEAGYEVPDPNK